MYVRVGDLLQRCRRLFQQLQRCGPDRELGTMDKTLSIHFNPIRKALMGLPWWHSV